MWATDTIPADLPPMMEFKAKADKIIKERWGIEVEHVSSGVSFEQGFYFTRGRTGRKTKFDGKRYGWPMQRGQWCLQQLKLPAINKISKRAIQYIGIAADEPSRFHNLTDTKESPLVVAGWTEADCRCWCEVNDLLSPIYTTATRGGCWFCHNQSVDQLRLLRKNYPELWALMLKWDAGSPRYKALGNSIALPQWWWITCKMAQFLPEHATLGSLFDGIGGFPLVWETLHGKGTAVWASEIEEFPIAVTKARFPE